jgi:hypothetical protein
MDQSVISSISSIGGSFGVLALLVLQLFQMFLDFRTNDQTSQITELKKLHQENQAEIRKNQDQISSLQLLVFELKEENATLLGLLGSQEQKADLIKQILEKKVKVMPTPKTI